jgi:hypothetical protein
VFIPESDAVSGLNVNKTVEAVAMPCKIGTEISRNEERQAGRQAVSQCGHFLFSIELFKKMADGST